MMINCLCPVTLRNDIQLPVETLQLLQILGTEHSQELILNLHDFPLISNLIQVLNIDQNILHQIGLQLR